MAVAPLLTDEEIDVLHRTHRDCCSSPRGGRRSSPQGAEGNRLLPLERIFRGEAERDCKDDEEGSRKRRTRNSREGWFKTQ